MRSWDTLFHERLVQWTGENSGLRFPSEMELLDYFGNKNGTERRTLLRVRLSRLICTCGRGVLGLPCVQMN